MRKMALLIALLLLLLTSVTSAANWQWIISTDEHGYFFDTQTLVYNGRTNSYAYGEGAQYWMKTVYTPSSAAKLAEIYSDDRLYRTSWGITKERLDFTNRRVLKLGHETFYDENGNVITSHEFEAFTYDIIPDTIGEAIMEHIRDYCRKKKRY